MQQLQLSEEIESRYEQSYEKSLGYYFVKRCIDIIGSLVGLILLSPVFLITAAWVKIDSRGPVSFAQERVGKDGKLFKMYKFRSMCMNAEDML
ncbi:MAG: sugar transferase, partial [Bacillota bacterium]|nr:sugar transferase [Bacillota bacterium]